MNIIKKMIPQFIKKRIKEMISSDPTEVQYKIAIENVKRLKGKKVIVTGGTGAIGSAICHRLYCEGATVGICGRNIKKVDKLIKRIESEGEIDGTLIPLELDVTKEESIDRAIKQFVDETGGLDAFINNAGGSARENNKAVYEQNIQTVDEVINVNLRGTILCTQKASRIMINQKKGCIINLSSVVGLCGKSTMSDYAATKAGIVGFTKSIALELGKYNVRANCISPGMVNQTPFDYGTPYKESSQNCLGYRGHTDDVAGVVAFILSDDAGYITGHNFVVDGGRSLGLMGDN